MAYLRTWLIITKNRYLLLYGFLLLLFVGYALFSLPKNQEDSYVYEEINSQYDGLSAALKILGDNVDVTKATPAENEKLVVSIISQQKLIGSQKKNLLFEEYQDFTEASLAISTLRKEMYSLVNFQAVAEFMVPDYQNELDAAYYRELKKEGKTIYPIKNNLMLMAVDFFVMLGAVWFLIISLLSSDILVEEVTHLSIVKGYPESFIKRLIKKIVYLSLSTVLVLCLFILSVASLGLYFNLGDWNHPIPVFLTHYQTIPFWQYLLVMIAYSFIMSIFASLLSIVFNYLTKSFLISFFLSSSLVVIPLLFSSISTFTYLPFNYLNISLLLTGELVSKDAWLGPIFQGTLSLLVSSLLLIVIISKLITGSALYKIRGAI